MFSNQINTTSFYQFSSPRYNSVRSFESILIPENYHTHDSINGSYDKLFPCYSLTESDKPKTQLVLQDNQTIDLVGSFQLKEVRKNIKTKYIGKKINPDKPYNNNLDRKEVLYNLYEGMKLNTGWSVIQTRTKNNYKEPLFLVRCLGDTNAITAIFAIPLDETINKFDLEVEIGTIVSYKSNIWRCIAKTKEYPPKTPVLTTNYWKLYRTDNVFNADVFTLSRVGSNYLIKVTDQKRSFLPQKQKDDTLVVWNLAYYHS